MKTIKENLKNFSDEHGGTWLYWHSVSHHIELIKRYKHIFKNYIDKNTKVIDLGAGRLFYKDILLAYTDKYKSLDFKKTHKDIDYIGTTSNTNLPDNSFDFVFCSQVLEHVPDPEESFEEIKRILKKDGIAVIAIPFLMYLHNEPYDFFRYTKYALKMFAKENNFEIIKLIEVGGLLGFLGSLISAFLIGLTWNIPILKWFFYFINLLIQYLFYLLDDVLPTKKIFPANYLLIIRDEN